jgi:hypothetical protein
MPDQPGAGIDNVFNQKFATKGVCGRPAIAEFSDDHDVVRQEENDRCAFSDHYPEFDQQTGSRDTQHSCRQALVI